MFLALDESYGSSKTTVGCLCLPVDDLPKYEALFIQKRLKEKVWGEIKWKYLSEEYLSKYKVLVSSYLSPASVTFHSWTYSRPSQKILRECYGGNGSRVVYHHAYMLIRNVIRKCLNENLREPFYIVPDSSGRMGEEEYRIIRDLLLQDSSIKPQPKLDFCSNGNSAVCGALQVCDVCTGATQFVYGEIVRQNRKVAKEFVRLLVQINKGIPINYSPKTLPRLSDYKIHHCLFIPPQEA